MTYSTYGRHIIIDMWEIDFKLLDDLNFLQEHLKKAAEQSHANVLSIESKKFDPSGVTILVLLSESHLSIHTYPEKGFAGVDCYTCGNTVDPQIAIDYLISVLNPQKTYAKKLIRGSGIIDITSM
jgi:S-adenosylmethionine decarboxylase